MTQIWAHRGCSLIHPENTLPAFVAASQSAADGVELDVQLSADGVPVVIHDERVDRTHEGTGWVVRHTAAELAALPVRGGGEAPIPTLDDVLAVLAPSHLLVNLELKNSEVDYPGLEEKVLAAVARHRLGERTMLSSFDHYSVARLVGLGVAQVAAICGEPLLRPWDYLTSLGAVALHPPLAALRDPDFVAEAHAHGFAIRLWTANDEQGMEAVIASGADGFFTDDPDLAARVRARYAS